MHMHMSAAVLGCILLADCTAKYACYSRHFFVGLYAYGLYMVDGFSWWDALCDLGQLWG